MDYQKQSWKNSDYWICIHQADRIKQLPTQACGYLSSCASKHMLAIVFSVPAWVGQEMFLHVIAHEWPQKNERDLTDEKKSWIIPLQVQICIILFFFSRITTADQRFDRFSC